MTADGSVFASAFATACLGLALGLTALLLAALSVLRRVREVHHGYAGAALLVVAPALPLWLAVPIALLGLYLLVDDLRQHGVEALADLRNEPVPSDYTRVHQVNVVRWRDTPPNVRRWVYTVAALFVAIAAGGWLLEHRGASSAQLSALPPAVVTRIQLAASRDSERTVRDDGRAAAREQGRLVVVHTHVAMRANRLAEDLTAQVDSLERLDSIAHARISTDTAALTAADVDTSVTQSLSRLRRIADGWHAVADARAAAVAETDSALHHAVAAISIHEVVEGQAEGRLDRVEQNGNDLEATAIAQAQTIAAGSGGACHIGPRWLHVRCPSRKAVAVLAAGGTLVVGAVVAILAATH